MEPGKLMILKRRSCEGCRELAEMRRVAQDRAAEIRRLEHEVEALRRQNGAANNGGATAAARVRPSLFETPSIAEIPLATNGAQR
jgi:hypothetical protein